MKTDARLKAGATELVESKSPCALSEPALVHGQWRSTHRTLSSRSSHAEAPKKYFGHRRGGNECKSPGHGSKGIGQDSLRTKDDSKKNGEASSRGNQRLGLFRHFHRISRPRGPRPSGG